MSAVTPTWPYAFLLATRFSVSINSRAVALALLPSRVLPQPLRPPAPTPAKLTRIAASHAPVTRALIRSSPVALLEPSTQAQKTRVSPVVKLRVPVAATKGFVPADVAVGDSGWIPNATA